MTRRQAREQAFVFLFEHTFQPDVAINELIEMAAQAGLCHTDSFATRLAVCACEHMTQLDQAIDSNLIGWSKERISRVSLSILRLALCEILFQDDIPTSVSINEAVELAKLYASAEDVPFVNGVLGSISRQLEV